jgi:hypothetical protein
LFHLTIQGALQGPFAITVISRLQEVLPLEQPIYNNIPKHALWIMAAPHQNNHSSILKVVLKPCEPGPLQWQQDTRKMGAISIYFKEKNDKTE